MAKYGSDYEYEIYRRNRDYQSNKAFIIVPLFLIFMGIIMYLGWAGIY